MADLPTQSPVRDLQLREACAELDRRLRAGEPRPAEALLAAFPNLAADPDSALQLIYDELVGRERLGELPAYEEYYQRFPQWRQELRKSFDIHEALVRRGQDRAAESATLPPPRPAAVPGQSSGGRRYELLDKIGRGGMGVVYRARQPGLNRIVALKMILAGEWADAEEQARFRREAETAAQLQHPNIVQVYEVGEQDGRLFLAMEYVAGGSLHERLAETPLPARPAAELVATLARAVHHAHEHGIIHRDLKPANILFVNGGCKPPVEGGEIGGETGGLRPPFAEFVPKIADFGLAKCLQSEPGATGLPGQTQTGDILGTPSYAAPEQTAGRLKQVGPATDVYALGAILYDCLTGRPPFRGTTIVETLEQVRDVDPLPPSRLQPKLPRDLETICLKCLRKEPARRYASARALAEDLSRFLAGLPIQARPTSAAERLRKWVRRRPGVAALCATIFLLVAMSFVALTWQWRVTLRALQGTEAARLEQQRQREAAEANLAARNVALARFHWLTHEFDEARALLLACPTNYRTDEWDELVRLCTAQLFCLKVLEEVVGVLQWTADSQQLIGCSYHGSTRVWEAASGKLVHQHVSHEIGNLNTFHHMHVSHDGPDMTIARRPSKEGRGTFEVGAFQLHRLDLRSGQRQVTPIAATAKAHVVAISPRGRWLAMADSKGVHLFDGKSSDLVRTFAPRYDQSQGTKILLFSPDETRLAGVGWIGGVNLWDVTKGQSIALLPLPKTVTIREARFSPDGRLFGAAGQIANRQEGYVAAWDLAREPPTSVFTSQELPKKWERLAFSPDARYVAWCSPNFEIVLRELATGREARLFRGHKGFISDLAFSPDGRRLASSSFDQTVRIWDTSHLE